MSLTRVIAICGPTATGKSELAERVALRLGGEVVSIDSMQVYRGMDIGTAKRPEAARLVPLHMVDVCEVSTPYAVAEFQRDARACVDACAGRGKVAILCGGTGLYLDATIDEMSFPVGETGGATRSRYEQLAQERGNAWLHAELARRDPRSAELIHPHNVRRVVRALEMADEGVSYADTHEGLRTHVPHYEARIWATTMGRDELYARIDERVDEMFAAGLVEEVRRLETAGIRASVTARQAIGYKEVLDALAGECTLDQACDLVKRNTRRYAKRQLSWIRRDGRARVLDLSRLTLDEATEMVVDDWRSS